MYSGATDCYQQPAAPDHKQPLEAVAMAGANTTPKISTLHLAWAAGFLEGEGSFSGGGPHGGPAVTAAQVHKEPIDRLLSLFGGSAYQRITKGFSTKPIWVWRLNTKQSAALMMTLYVLMSPKRQGEIASAIHKWKNQGRALKSHNSNICGKGHELTETNTFWVLGKYRKCRICRAAAKRARRARLRAAGLKAS